MAAAVPIMPVVANGDLRALLNSTLGGNLALPITHSMVQRVHECSALVAMSRLATDAEKGEFLQFAHQVQHAQQSCVILTIYILYCTPALSTLHSITYSGIS